MGVRRSPNVLIFTITGRGPHVSLLVSTLLILGWDVTEACYREISSHSPRQGTSWYVYSNILGWDVIEACYREIKLPQLFSFTQTRDLMIRVLKHTGMRCHWSLLQGDKVTTTVLIHPDKGPHDTCTQTYWNWKENTLNFPDILWYILS